MAAWHSPGMAGMAAGLPLRPSAHPPIIGQAGAAGLPARLGAAPLHPCPPGRRWWQLHGPHGSGAHTHRAGTHPQSPPPSPPPASSGNAWLNGGGHQALIGYNRAHGTLPHSVNHTHDCASSPTSNLCAPHLPSCAPCTQPACATCTSTPLTPRLCGGYVLVLQSSPLPACARPVPHSLIPTTHLLRGVSS